MATPESRTPTFKRLGFAEASVFAFFLLHRPLAYSILFDPTRHKIFSAPDSDVRRPGHQAPLQAALCCNAHPKLLPIVPSVLQLPGRPLLGFCNVCS
ncbi:hypothetical protein JAAARDRAFT_254781 [Jaapia argillacea MUCL 33604]|uniref:Uncharacterized protein n=1 Tax=Jaapia argillacea MUCL 33604 TaxID=933084 RepID=A0A067Q5Z9_9AGAM|nr:hypothetical protein JAAARDRAFT_254781 [Jaapia argillacea MUCL 33604]